MSTANIDPKFALALQQAVRKGLDTELARAETGPGVYRNITIDLTVEVDEMRVAPDTDKAPTSSIPLLATCALLLKRFGPAQQGAALNMMREVLTEALELSNDAQKRLLEETGIAQLEKQLREEVIAKLPRVPVKGAVTVKPEDVRVTLRRMSMSDEVKS